MQRLNQALTPYYYWFDSVTRLGDAGREKKKPTTRVCASAVRDETLSEDITIL
jgi:hypothetical protein